MKRTLFFCATLMVASIFAQDTKKDKLVIKKGTWLLNGSLSFSNSDFDNVRERLNSDGETMNFRGQSDNSSFAVFSNVGYTLAKNLILGVGLGYTSNSREAININEEELTSFNSDSFNRIRYQAFIRGLLPIGKRFALFAQAEIGFAQSEQEFFDELLQMQLGNFKSDQFFIQINPGIMFFVSKNFAFEGSLGNIGYSRTTSEDENFPVVGADGELLNGTERESSNNSFRFDISSANLSLGLSYYF